MGAAIQHRGPGCSSWGGAAEALRWRVSGALRAGACGRGAPSVYTRSVYTQGLTRACGVPTHTPQCTEHTAPDRVDAPLARTGPEAVACRASPGHSQALGTSAPPGTGPCLAPAWQLPRLGSGPHGHTDSQEREGQFPLGPQR